MQQQPLLEMRDIWKTFPGIIALAGAKLQLLRGEIHALVGENGAGKTTLIKILTGALRRDQGTIQLDGQTVHFHSPFQAQAGGIGTIYQEVNLVPRLSVAENIHLRHEPRRWRMIDRHRMNSQAAAQLEQLGVTIDVKQPLATYGIAI
jgi:monosaccharide-transporting ATPase